MLSYLFEHQSVDVLLVLVLCVSLILGIRRMLVTILVVGGSMLPEFHPGDRLLGLRLWPKRIIQKGTIGAVFRESEAKDRFADESLRLKRIVGVSGDSVISWFQDLPEHLKPTLSKYYDSQGKRIFTVPKDSLFIQGDNSKFSIDSRLWGSISTKSIYAVVVARIKSDANWISSPNDDTGSGLRKN